MLCVIFYSTSYSSDASGANGSGRPQKSLLKNGLGPETSSSLPRFRAVKTPFPRSTKKKKRKNVLVYRIRKRAFSPKTQTHVRATPYIDEAPRRVWEGDSLGVAWEPIELSSPKG